MSKREKIARKMAKATEVVTYEAGGTPPHEIRVELAALTAALPMIERVVERAIISEGHVICCEERAAIERVRKAFKGLKK